MIILDTHAWLWYYTKNVDKISTIAMQMIQTKRYGISIISCLEIALLVEKKRIQLQIPVMRWITQAVRHPDLTVINMTPEILVASTQLTKFHRDPADRIIAATCQQYDYPLITKDKRIHNWGQITTIW